MGRSSVFIFQLAAVRTAELIYAKTSHACVNSQKYFERKSSSFSKPCFFLLFFKEGQFAGCKKKVLKISLVENCNVGTSAEQPNEIIFYEFFNEFHFLLKINQMKPRFLIFLEH